MQRTIFVLHRYYVQWGRGAWPRLLRYFFSGAGLGLDVVGAFCVTDGR